MLEVALMAGVAAAKTLRPCRLVLTRQGNNLECSSVLSILPGKVRTE